MKRKEIVFVLFSSILLLSLFSFVSAGMFSNTFKKTQITGEVIDPVCSDSDNGKDYFTKGTIVGGGASFVQYDYCLTLTSTGQTDAVSCEASNPDCRLHEFYCENGTRVGVRVNCDYGCSDGACIKYQNQTQFQNQTQDKNKTQEQDENLNQGQSNKNLSSVDTGVNCEFGCVMDEKCYPLGYRKARQYCYENNTFIPQTINEAYCENSFECRSNLCIDDECVNQGVFKKMMNWFKNSFRKRR